MDGPYKIITSGISIVYLHVRLYLLILGEERTWNYEIVWTYSRTSHNGHLM